MEWVSRVVSMVQPPSDHLSPDSAQPTPEPPQPGPSPSGPSRGWPLPVKVLLAVLVLAFVWSPFLAMLYRLSRPNPSLAPTAIPGTGTPSLPAPAVTAPEAGRGRSAPPGPAPSP
jgi:hypothetical protein